MSKVAQKLQFQVRNGNTTLFVDPTLPASTFSQKLTGKRINVGGRSERLQVSEHVQVREYIAKSCKDDCGVKQYVTGRVNLSGVNASEVSQMWEDMKLNVDKALANGALAGVNINIGFGDFINTHIIEDTP